jgi:hypothetical protein
VVVARDHDFGDWQRDIIGFGLAEPRRVRIRFRYDGGISAWTGSLHLTRSGARPIHIIGHNRNTREAIDRSLALGANRIEGDFGRRRLLSAGRGGEQQHENKRKAFHGPSWAARGYYRTGLRQGAELSLQNV